jgi:hypothetical protein
MGTTSRHTDHLDADPHGDAGEPPRTLHGHTLLSERASLPSEQGMILDLAEDPLAAPTLAELHDQWNATSRARLGFSRQQWHHPATLDLVEAMGRGDDLSDALHRLGEARAGAGLSLDETLADLGVLAELTPSACHLDRDVGVGRVDTLRAASMIGTAWAEAFYADVAAPGCTDPMTGLVTGTYLLARIAQLYQQCAAAGRRPDREHALVVLQIHCHDLSPFACMAARIHAAGRLRSTFPDADTLAILEPTNAMVVLVDATEEVTERVAALRAAGPDDAIWVEHLGTTATEGQALVRELSTIPRAATIAHGTDVSHP